MNSCYTFYVKNKSAWVLFFIFVCEAAGVIGSVTTFPAIPTWFATLNKPVFSPPNWLFGPVWTMLYALMGISIFLMFQKLHAKTMKKKNLREIKSLIVLFFVHLAINTLWSIVFFGMREILAAYVVILLLWIMIAVMILRFYKFSHVASWLLVPYFFWVSFASLLNYAIWQLN